MMTFSCVNLNDISKNELDALISINEWFYPVFDLTEVYIVQDNNDIKTVLCLDFGFPHTEVGLSIGTKKDERNKGYCDFGFYMIMEVVKSNPSIKELLVNAKHEATEKLCKKNGFKEYSSKCFSYKNPNFNPKYEELYNMIDKQSSLEELIDYCEDDEVMLSILNYWLGLYGNNQSLRMRW